MVALTCTMVTTDCVRIVLPVPRHPSQSPAIFPAIIYKWSIGLTRRGTFTERKNAANLAEHFLRARGWGTQREKDNERNVKDRQRISHDITLCFRRDLRHVDEIGVPVWFDPSSTYLDFFWNTRSHVTWCYLLYTTLANSLRWSRANSSETSDSIVATLKI